MYNVKKKEIQCEKFADVLWRFKRKIMQDNLRASRWRRQCQTLHNEESWAIQVKAKEETTKS